MYEARKVTNLLLSRFDAQENELTNMKIQKLLYFIQGWSTLRYKNGLIRNHFEAWSHGPVIPSLYESLKSYGNRPVLSLLSHMDYSSGAESIIGYDNILEAHKLFCLSIAGKYCKKSASKLRRLSHELDGPWDRTLRECDAGVLQSRRIPYALIKAHFSSKIGENITLGQLQ